WAQAFARGDYEIFRRRLLWDGIDTPTVRAAMAKRVPCGFPTAKWVNRFVEFVDEARSCAPRVGTPDWDQEVANAGGTDSPFADVWIPMLRVARQQALRDRPTYQEW